MSNHALKTIHVVAALIFRDTPQKQVLVTQRGYGDFKREVADVVCHLLEKIQANYQKFKNPEILDNILNDGAKKARIVASETLERAKLALGLK